MDINLADGVRHLYLSGINSVSNHKHMGLRTWLLNNRGFIVEPKGANVFSLQIYDRADILDAVSFDINRLATASLETLLNINYETVTQKFLAWKLINYYYSAFFSAHCLLKILGFGLVQIDDRISSQLKRNSVNFGYNEAVIQKGAYCFDFIIKTGQVAFYRVERYNDSHQGLWHRFSDLIDVLSANAVRSGNFDASCVTKHSANASYPESIFAHLPQNDAIVIVQRLEALRKILNKRGNNNWLSTTRNALNYNHEYGVWFPYNDYLNEYNQISSYSEWCFRHPMDTCFDTYSTNELNEFVQCCQFINSMTFEVLDDLIFRHPSDNSFLKRTFNAYRLLYKTPS